jgi:D-glycero-D-manno-heptose 1,7-bisphosphate phosphatase
MWKIDKSWSLFLDRDGVINIRKPGGYIKNWDEFVFEEGVLNALKIFDPLFQNIIVVTNQQGIGKGLMTEYDLLALHKMMMKVVYLLGGRIDAAYHCSSLAAENDSCRKPNTGMGLKAKQQFPNISFEKSIMIGDSNSDLEFGKRLGMKTVFITGKGEVPTVQPDLVCDSLQDFAALLLKQSY